MEQLFAALAQFFLASPFCPLSPSTKSLVLFCVVSSSWLVLNADVKDELLGYAADVSAVSCLQIHLERHSPTNPHSLSLYPSPPAEKKRKVKTIPPLTTWQRTMWFLCLWPLWVWACLGVCVSVCRHVLFIYLISWSCRIKSARRYIFCITKSFFLFFWAFSHMWHHVGGRKQQPGGGHKSQLLFVWETGGRALAV